MSREAEHWFHQRAAFYVEAQLLFHLSQAGVFTLLRRDGPLTTPEIAGRLALSESVLQAVLDYVHGVDDLLVRSELGWGVSAFGVTVLERYGRGERINFFDVRVGGYGPVWEGVGRMLRGEQVSRHGQAAAEGVYKVGARFAPGVQAIVQELRPSAVLEVGVTTGLLEDLPGARIGLDRSRRALDQADRRAADPAISWIEADVFDPASWAANLPAGGLLFSVHFHELAAQGAHRVAKLLDELADHLDGWSVLALEQPRLPEADRGRIDDADWLYAQANVLIHHLIGNGRILPHHEWTELFGASSRTLISAQPLGYLGYHAYLARLG